MECSYLNKFLRYLKADLQITLYNFLRLVIPQLRANSQFKLSNMFLAIVDKWEEKFTLTANTGKKKK